MKNLDKILLATVIILTGIGLVLIFSASTSLAMINNKNLTHYFYHQLKVILFALGVFAAGILIPYEFYKKYSIFFMFIILLLLILVLFTNSKNGASRWFNILGQSIQPTEIAKLALVFHISRLIVRQDERIKNFKKLLIPVVWIALVSGLTAFQPNYSNAIIIGFSGSVLLYVGGAKKRHLFAILLVGGIFISVAMWFTPHSHARIAGWLGMNETEHLAAPNEQVEEALIGIGSGGLTGVGIGKSEQANLFLAEAYSDFIFAILGEELGFIGSVVVSSLYILFFLLSLLSMQHIEDKYGGLVVFGLSFNIVLSAIINIFVVLGIIPTTGITLPFISYGGSSLTVFVFSVGVILNINTDGRISYIIVNFIKKGFRLFLGTKNARIQ